MSQTDFRVIFKKFVGLDINNEDIGYLWHRLKLSDKMGDKSQEISNKTIDSSETCQQMISY